MAESGVVTGFKVMLVVMFFYSFCILVVTYTLPDSAKAYVTGFSSDDFNDIQGLTSEVQGGLTKQTNIPVIDMGALVFYSGNLLLDLLLNFLYAIPEMLGFLLYGLTRLFNVDTVLVAYIQILISAVISALYIMGIIQMLAGLRSGVSVI